MAIKLFLSSIYSITLVEITTQMTARQIPMLTITKMGRSGRGGRSRSRSRSRSRGRRSRSSKPASKPTSKPTPIPKTKTTSAPDPGADGALLGLGLGYLLGRSGNKNNHQREYTHGTDTDYDVDDASDDIKNIYQTCKRVVNSVDDLLPSDSFECRELATLYFDNIHHDE